MSRKELICWALVAQPDIEAEQAVVGIVAGDKGKTEFADDYRDFDNYESKPNRKSESFGVGKYHRVPPSDILYGASGDL